MSLICCVRIVELATKITESKRIYVGYSCTDNTYRLDAYFKALDVNVHAHVDVAIISATYAGIPRPLYRSYFNFAAQPQEA